MLFLFFLATNFTNYRELLFENSHHQNSVNYQLLSIKLVTIREIRGKRTIPQ